MSDLPGTRSAWMDPSLRLERPALDADTQADVCIIGAGMAGMLCAYSLARAGRRPVVLEAHHIGAGETGRTTAHLANALDDRYFKIEHTHGPDASRTCAASHTAGIDLFERITIDEDIPCEFTRLDGYLFLPPGENRPLLARELEAARRAGLLDVEHTPRAPSFDSGPCLRFPNQAQFHPLRFLDGLARAIERLGGRIHTRTRIAEIKSGAPLGSISAAGFTIRAPAIIVATNTPINDTFTMHTKQTAYRTYAIALRVPTASVTRALYWDTSEQADNPDGPYHYVRITPDTSDAPTPGHELLIVGGGDHPTGENRDPAAEWRLLEAWARAHWRVAREVAFRWSGQVIEPMDGVAFIGRNPTGPDGVFIITGDSGMGMTHSAIAALMMPDLLTGADHPWAKLYDPARKPVTALGEFAARAAKVALHYADRLAAGAEVDNIAPGQGRVVRRGLKLLAVHRDADGQVRARSAVCTHLGCVVQWNDAEKSWDCPCHGSRFDALGRVLNGPAVRDLPEEPL